MSIQSSTSSIKSKARLDAEFEDSASSFVRLSSGVRVETKVSTECDKVSTSYLHQLQNSNLIQPFGFLLAVDDKTFRVIAYSENAPEMLTTVSQTVLNVGYHQILSIGCDVRTLFSPPSAQTLQKALEFEEVSLQNPILVHSKSSRKSFYAIAHRITGTLIIDFEPVQPHDSPMATAGTFQSSKLAVKSISHLQSVASGSIEKLCDAMVQEVFELTGYDRVMAYKFHGDDHGEVLSEITKPGLEPYVGFHYPPTDIPQAARFFFMKNKVSMIPNCRMNHVEVIQDEKLPFDISFCGSTLWAPHSCHLQYMKNMNSIASLVMSVVVNERDVKERFNKESSSELPERIKRLWGLVVCHNTTPRFIPFPLRYACEFLTQVFAVHVNKELELENHVAEKNILRTQMLLCDVLLRDSPLGIMSQSPNVMDLVKCDGAALLFKNKIYKLGLAPTDSQIHDLVLWLNENYEASPGFITNSLSDSHYPGALALGDVVCGIAAVRIADNDWLFWFRSHTAAKVRWGGAKHDPGEIDDGRRIPSFEAFLEVVKTKGDPWKDYEMHAIHFMQQILGHAFKKVDTRLKRLRMISSIN